MYNLGITAYIDFSHATISGAKYTFPENIQNKLIASSAVWALNYNNGTNVIGAPCVWNSDGTSVTFNSSEAFSVSGNVLTKV